MVQTGKTTCYSYKKHRSLNVIVPVLRWAVFWSIFGNICKTEWCCRPFALVLVLNSVMFWFLFIARGTCLILIVFNLLSTLPLLFLWHLLILLALNPPSCSLPDDIGGPQPGPFLVSVMGASLQSLPLPLPPPPPLHATIQHSLSLNGKTWVQWRGRCVCVSGCLSGSESRFQPPLSLAADQLVLSEAPLFH